MTRSNGTAVRVKETWYRRSYRSLEAVTLIKVYVQSRSYAADAVSSVNVKESSDTVKVKVEGAVVAMSESVYRLRRFGGGPVNVSCWHVRDVTPAASRATVSRIERGDRRRNLATAKAK